MVMFRLIACVHTMPLTLFRTKLGILRDPQIIFREQWSRSWLFCCFLECFVEVLLWSSKESIKKYYNCFLYVEYDTCEMMGVLVNQRTWLNFVPFLPTEVSKKHIFETHHPVLSLFEASLFVSGTVSEHLDPKRSSTINLYVVWWHHFHGKNCHPFGILAHRNRLIVSDFMESKYHFVLKKNGDK